MCWAGPIRRRLVAVDGTSAAPPGMSTRTSAPTRPHWCAQVGRGDSTGAARLGDARAPLPHAQAKRVGATGDGDELDVDAVGEALLEPRPVGRQVDGVGVVDQRPRGAGCPRRRCRGDAATRRSATASGPPRAPVLAAPISTLTMASRWSATVVHGDDARTPPSVPTAQSALCSPRASATAWPRQRMPLPLISARLPSAFHSVMTTSTPAGSARDGRRGSARRRRCPAAVAQGTSAVAVHGDGAVDLVEHDEEVVAEAVVLGEAA